MKTGSINNVGKDSNLPFPVRMNHKYTTEGSILKRGFRLWIKMTDTYMKTVPLLLSSIFFIITIFYVEPVYIERINALPFKNKQLIFMLGSLIVLLAFGITMMNTMGEVMKREYQMQYWLVISKQEFFIYLFLKEIYWYYFFLILMYIVSGELWKHKFFLCVFFTLLYITLNYLIYLKKDADRYRGIGRIQAKQRKSVRCKDCRMFIDHPNIELIFLGWKYRYAYVGNLICKAGVMVSGIFLLKWSFSENTYFIVYFVMFLLVILVDDDSWKKETGNVPLLQSMGIAFGKFFFINIISGIWFYSALISLLYGLASRSAFSGIFFLILSVCLVCYWTAAYLFIYLSKAREIEPLKLLFLIAALILGLIPIINLGAGILFYRKARAGWRKISC